MGGGSRVPPAGRTAAVPAASAPRPTLRAAASPGKRRPRASSYDDSASDSDDQQQRPAAKRSVGVRTGALNFGLVGKVSADPTTSAQKSAAKPTACPRVAGSEEGSFCVCGCLDDDPDATFIACTVGTGGCHGWVHCNASCSGLSEHQIDDIILGGTVEGYVCRLCKETPVCAKEKKAQALAADDDGAWGDIERRERKMERSSSSGSAAPSSRSSLMRKMKPSARGR